MAAKKTTSNTEIDGDQISPKSTKEQILSAYQEAMKRLEENQLNSPQEEKKTATSVAVVAKASKNSIDSIISDLAGLKLSLTKQVESLEENLTSEFRKLSELRQAIEIENEHLQELYNIKESTHRLSALILAQQEQKNIFEKDIEEQRQTFDQEMKAKKEAFAQQKAVMEQENAEYKAHIGKTRTREEEEYSYALELSRRKDKDDYQTKKAILEKELENKRQEMTERENLLKLREEELNNLRQQVELFPTEVEKARTEAIQKTTEELELKYQFETKLKEQEIQGEKKLQEQRISSLEAKIKEQRDLIDQLTKKADSAVSQVQAIACRALDSSAQRMVPMFQEEKFQEKPK